MDIQSVLSHQDNVSPEHQSQRPYTYANDSVLPSGVSKTQTISYPTQGRHGNQTFGREIHRLYVNNNASVLPSGISRQQSSSHPLSGYQPHGSHRPPEQGSSSQRQDVEPILEELDSVLARNPYQVINDVLDCAPVPDDVTNHCQDGGQRKASHPGASRPGSPPLKSTEEHNVTVVTPTTTPEGEAIYETIGKPCWRHTRTLNYGKPCYAAAQYRHSCVTAKSNMASLQKPIWRHCKSNMAEQNPHWRGCPSGQTVYLGRSNCRLEAV